MSTKLWEVQTLCLALTEKELEDLKPLLRANYFTNTLGINPGVPLITTLLRADLLSSIEYGG